MGAIFTVLVAVLCYYVWDGFFPRKLENVDVKGIARVVTSGWVEFPFYPIDQSRIYIAVYLENPTEYIIREVSIWAKIKTKTDVTINVNAPCLGPHSQLRILAGSNTGRQTCIVPLNAEDSKLVPVEGWGVDSDVKLTWGFSKIEGHSQPVRFLDQIAESLSQTPLRHLQLENCACAAT